jgi:hypothetical protein
MAVQLIKTGARIALGHPLKVHSDKILCDRCDQNYEFHYPPGEEHRLKEWLPKAKAAVNKSHTDNHPETLALPY